MSGLKQWEIQLRGGGKLDFWEEGQLVQMRAFRPDDGRGLYKVWIRGAGGGLLLGTLVPEGNGLGLQRRLSRGQLERAGCWPVVGGETVLAFAFVQSGWQWEKSPEHLVKDVVLRQVLKGKSVRIKRQQAGFSLAAVFDTGRPFPVVPLFCLTAIERVEGDCCAVFLFDREGKPVPPHNQRRDGENSSTS